MNIEAQQKEILDEFSQFQSWEERYKKIIQMGKEVPEFSEDDRQEKYLIKGCQSQVWMIADHRDGKLFLRGDSDAVIVKGLLALFLKVYSGADLQEVIKSNASFITDLGLNVHLSQSRSNGIQAMLKQIKLYAMAFLTMETQKKLEESQ